MTLAQTPGCDRSHCVLFFPPKCSDWFQARLSAANYGSLYSLLNNWLIFVLCIVDSAAASSKWLWATSWWPGSTYCGTNFACHILARRGRRTMTSSWRRTPPSWRAPTPWTCSMSSPCTHSWDQRTPTLWSASTQWEINTKNLWPVIVRDDQIVHWFYRLKHLLFLLPSFLLPRFSCLTSYLPMVNHQSHCSPQSRRLPLAGAGPAARR